MLTHWLACGFPHDRFYDSYLGKFQDNAEVFFYVDYDVYANKDFVKPNLYHNDARIRSFYNNAFGFDWNNEFFACANTDFLKEVSGYYAFVPKKQPKLSRKAWHAIVPSIATKDYLGIWSF